MKAAAAAPHQSNGGGGQAMMMSELGEVAVVREVLCACQGFDGRHVRFNAAAMKGLGGFDISPEAGVPPVQRHLMLKLCELGWLFRCEILHHDLSAANLPALPRLIVRSQC
jgi:hypothetical protein